MPDALVVASLRKKVVGAIKTVFDPELPVDIYELGLIYDIRLDVEEKHAHIVMTLTTPSCPAADSLLADVERAVGSVPGIDKVRVELTFEPAYTTDRLSDEARLALGWL